MLFILGDIVMRILSKRQLRELVLYSPQHVARLEKAEAFPKRVILGPTESDGLKMKCWIGSSYGWTAEKAPDRHS